MPAKAYFAGRGSEELEDVAVKQLIATRAVTKQARLDKLAVLGELVKEGTCWKDGRDLALLESVREDVRRYGASRPRYGPLWLLMLCLPLVACRHPIEQTAECVLSRQADPHKGSTDFQVFGYRDNYAKAGKDKDLCRYRHNVAERHINEALD